MPDFPNPAESSKTESPCDKFAHLCNFLVLLLPPGRNTVFPILSRTLWKFGSGCWTPCSGWFCGDELITMHIIPFGKIKAIPNSNTKTSTPQLSSIVVLVDFILLLRSEWEPYSVLSCMMHNISFLPVLVCTPVSLTTHTKFLFRGKNENSTVSSPLEIHRVSSELVYVSRKVYLILIYI